MHADKCNQIKHNKDSGNKTIKINHIKSNKLLPINDSLCSLVTQWKKCNYVHVDIY